MQVMLTNTSTRKSHKHTKSMLTKHLMLAALSGLLVTQLLGWLLGNSNGHTHRWELNKTSERDSASPRDGIRQTAFESESVDRDSSIGRISPEDAKTKIEAGEAIVIDVRSPLSYGDEIIRGAKLIPLDALEGNVGQLPRAKAVITYCS